jgi:hypothetical protein
MAGAFFFARARGKRVHSESPKFTWCSVFDDEPNALWDERWARAREAIRL